MSHTYPYKSERRKSFTQLQQGRDYAEWTSHGLDLQREVGQLKGPVIEIGGPTESGHYFLDGLTFAEKPVITNITRDIQPYAESAGRAAELIDELMDARDMPYEDGSVSVFIMEAMSVTTDWYLTLSEDEQERQADQISGELDIAELEMQQVAIGSLDPHDVRYAQRVPIYLEIKRTLCDGGLLFTDGGLEEVRILQRLGFSLLAYTQEHIRADTGWTGIAYEFVVQKTA